MTQEEAAKRGGRVPQLVEPGLGVVPPPPPHCRPKLLPLLYGVCNQTESPGAEILLPHWGHVSGLGWEAERWAGRARKESALCGRHRMQTALSRVGAMGLRLLGAPDPEQDFLEDCGQQCWGFSLGAALYRGPDAHTRKPHRPAACAPRTLLTTPFCRVSCFGGSCPLKIVQRY